MESQGEILDLQDLTVLEEPDDLFRELRREKPVTRARGPGGQEFFIVTDHRLIDQATKRVDDFSNDIEHVLLAGGNANPEVSAILQQNPFDLAGLITKDPPDHTRNRALVNAAFSQGRLVAISATIERLADELIDSFIEKGECNFVEEFAELLPTYIIADILGLSRKDYHLVRDWSDASIRIVSRMGSAHEEIEAARMVVAFREFVRDAIRQRRSAPADDLISQLVGARAGDFEPLADDEIAPLVMEIATAGNETTRNTLAGGLHRLLERPDQIELLRADPGLMPNAVEEILRLETPVTANWRVARRQTEIGGVVIPQGAEIQLRFDAANYDAGLFPDPQEMNVRRAEARLHYSFGAPGIHRCLGQMLARKELAIAYHKLLARLGNVRVLSKPKRWTGIMHRGMSELRLSFDPGSHIYHTAADAA